MTDGNVDNEKIKQSPSFESSIESGDSRSKFELFQ